MYTNKARKDSKMTNKEECNYYGFMNELEQISKKYGIGILACGCFQYSDENGFQKITYRKNLSGDIIPTEIVLSDGTKCEL